MYADLAESLATRSTWTGCAHHRRRRLYAELAQYPYDVAKAKALVADAGIAGKKLVIATSPVSSNADILTQATAEAAKAIGLVPEIQSISPDKYTSLFSDPAARKGIDLFFTTWYVSLGDPMEMYGVLRTGEFSNYGGWSNAAYDAATEKALATADTVGASGVHRTGAEDRAGRAALAAALHGPDVGVAGSRITGVAPSINYMYYPWAATIGSTS